MKKVILIIAAAVLLSISSSCGKVKTYSEPNIPADPIEGAVGGVDNSTYPFEVPGDITGFSTSGSGFSSISISTEKAYMGTASLRVNVNYTAPNMQGRLNKPGVAVSTMLGKALSGHVWVPTGMFGTSTPYGAFFYIQFDAGNNNDWYQSTWQNLNVPSGAVKGLWNEVDAAVDSMILQNGNGSPGHVNGNTLSQNGITTGNVTLGFVVGQGGVSGNYSGHIFIDSINIQ